MAKVNTTNPAEEADAADTANTAANCPLHISVQTTPFDIACEYAALTAGDAACENGAAALFVGRVRGGDVQEMTLEHYPGMTERALTDIARAAAARWPLAAVRVLHRVGRLLPGDDIVLVATSSPHRAAATDACAYITDYLKTGAPFWKKETTADGKRWVESRASDDAARARWQQSSSNSSGGGNDDSQ